jgi:hypothetical protein
MNVEDSKENETICRKFCGDCPSYPESDEWLFCARGKSNKSVKRQGCNCPGCDVYGKYDLGSMYFCEMGAEE